MLGGMQRAMRLTAISVCVVLATGCGHWRDQGMIDAARALVPPETTGTGWDDKEGQYAMLNGDYEVRAYFDDGDLAPEAIVDAFTAHSAEQGWVEQLRCERPGAWIVYYTWEKWEGRLRVPKPPVEDDNSIVLQRVGDGIDWPPEACL